MMVCGDRKYWEEWEWIVLAIAPSAFYGGHKPAQANALGVALCTFMTSVYMVRHLPKVPQNYQAYGL
jgi:hypothetical protein